MAIWPAVWQHEAIAALEPLLGADAVVEVWVGDPLTSRHGTLLAGPVLRLTARARGHRCTVLVDHSSWCPDQT